MLAAIQALVHSGFLNEDPRKIMRNGSGDIHAVMPGWLIPTEKGRRAVGLWPTALDRIVAQLEAIANDAQEDDDTRSRARRILDGFTGAGREIGLAVAAAVLTGQVTGTS